MLSNITTKLALRKMGLSSDTFNFTSPEPAPKRRSAPGGGFDETDDDTMAGRWTSWMSVRKLPLTVQPWLSPPPPPVAVAAECPRVGDLAPLDRDRRLAIGGGRRVIVVFLRCVGCAFAQKTFLALRTLANRHASTLTCIAVSHSSAAATGKWLDLLGGAWNVQVVVDEDRAIYAAWGLGLGSVWYLLNPTTQVQGWREKGWLGATVATSIKRTGTAGAGAAGAGVGGAGAGRDVGIGDRTIWSETGATAGMTAGKGLGATGGQQRGNATGPAAAGEGPTTAMGNKWQESGAWAIDGRGTVVWGGKALRADDVLDLDAGARALGF